jgi:TonB-linked SusC/RagA family outer membrane protein
MKKLLLQPTGLTCNQPPYGAYARQLCAKLMIPFCLLLLLTLTMPAFAQTAGQVSGRVTDATGQALPGVTVRIKETSGSGTVTDVNGTYHISAAPDNTLVFSFVGSTTQEIRVANQRVIDVQLKDDTRTLNEVVVIGYQSVRKRDLTGAVSSISASDANRTTSASVTESLQGLSPGVTVRNSGAPGANSAIQIRGIGSLLSSQPLYVIDGMLSDANVTINNDDVESIQVLKDASAAAIYGSRAANGVIIITTKQGRSGAPKISVSAKYGKQYIPKTWDVMNSTQYAAIKREQYTAGGLPVPPSVASSTFNSAINTDWQALDERAGNDQNYNITISGGSDNSKYLISGSYYDNQSVLLANSFNRASLRINTETKKGILTFGENAVLTNSNTRYPGIGNAFFDLPTSLPTIPVRNDIWITSTNPQGFTNGTNDPAGGPQDISFANNILAGNITNGVKVNNAKLVGNGYIQLQLTSWLFYKFNAGLETSFDYTRNFFNGTPIRYGTPSAESSIGETRGQFTNVLLEHTLNFNKTFGVHNLNGVFGYTQQRESGTYTGGGRTGLTFIDGQYQTSINSATGSPTASGGTNVDWKIISYLGRINYTFNDKYLLTATARIDQDSRFGSNYRTGFFPSIAAAWRINKESFFKADWVNDLKINASYGILGVNTISQFSNSGYINSAPRAVLNGDVIQNGAYQASLYNPDVRWENRHETNIGVDASILNNRLTISAAVYNNVSKNALLIQQVSTYLGANNNPFVNAGSISNKGIEFSATYRNNTSDLKWSLSGNVTTIKNRVLSVGDQGGANYIVQDPDFTRAQIGHPIGSWFVLKDIGLFQSQAEIDNYKRSNGDVIEPFAKPGDVKFQADPNGRGSIGNNDRVFNGSALPNLQTGLQFNANYKQFSVNLQLVGTFGNKIFDAVRQSLDGYQNNNFRTDISPWTPSNTKTSDPRLGFATDPGIANNNTFASSRWIENGSYGRIRNLEFGYAFSKGLLSKWHVDNARIFISGQNLLTVTKYKGQDPDVTGNLLQPGYDNGGWPPSRVFSLGLNVGF